MSHHCYFDGQFVPLDTPLLKTNDLGLLRGYALFDYFRTYNGRPFRFEEYWARFTRSAASLGLAIPAGEEEARQIVEELYRRAEADDMAVRLLLTGGYSENGVSVTKPNFLVRSEPLPQDNPGARHTGIKVLPYEYVRDLPYVKSTGYVHMILMAEEMRKREAADLLFHKDGLVSELTRSNIFIVKGDVVATPGKDALKGITRKLVMEKATGKYTVEQRDISLEELLAADEVFTTSTTKWVMPVVQVGVRPIGSGKPGKVTLHLLRLLEEEFSQYGR